MSSRFTLDGLPPETPELELARLLAEYREARLQRLAGSSKRAQAASGLLLCSLQQRLFSSIEAFYRTLKVHAKTVERQRRDETMRAQDSGLDLLRGAIGSEDDRAEMDEEETGTEMDAQVEAATAVVSAADVYSEEQQLLSRMLGLAEAHWGEPDARVRYLTRWMREQMYPRAPPVCH